MIVPSSAEPTAASDRPIIEEQGMNASRLLIVLWSAVGLFALACALLLVWQSNPSGDTEAESVRRIAPAPELLSIVVF